MPEDESPVARDAYDQLADSYADDLETSPYHEHLAVPGTIDLVQAVDGERVLDAGCGTGVCTEWLLEQGADVVALDVSDAMLVRARDRVGDRATLIQQDLEQPLPFAADSFDGVLSVLVLDYVADWDATFAEFARVLEPGGFLVFTVPHPFDEFPLDDDENYFETEQRTKSWDVEVPYYRRPLSEMFEPLLTAGFQIEAVAEPQPTEGFREEWPERYETESKRPVFLCVRATLDDGLSASR